MGGILEVFWYNKLRCVGSAVILAWILLILCVITSNRLFLLLGVAVIALIIIRLVIAVYVVAAGAQSKWEGHLSHPDARLRLASLDLYTRTPSDVPRISDKISDIARHDPEELVRCSAVMALLSVFRTTWDRNILRLLAQLALDGAESAKVRKAAYWGLLGTCAKKGDIRIGCGRKARYEEYEVSDFDVGYLADILGGNAGSDGP
jgi:hypothetical protein